MAALLYSQLWFMALACSCGFIGRRCVCVGLRCIAPHCITVNQIELSILESYIEEFSIYIEDWRVLYWRLILVKLVEVPVINSPLGVVNFCSKNEVSLPRGFFWDCWISLNKQTREKHLEIGQSVCDGLMTCDSEYWHRQPRCHTGITM